MENTNSNTKRRVILWVSVIAGIGLIVFGMIKLAGSTPASTQTGSLSQAVSSSDWAEGNINSKVVLVEYSDFQCPACEVFYSVLKDIQAKYGNQMEFVYRHFPLSQHANARLAAQAAEAAGKQGKFWEMHDLLFKGQTTWASQSNSIAENTFISYAQSLKLNTDQFKSDISSQTVINKVENDYQSGLKSGVDGTPTFFLNGKKLPPPSSYADFESTISNAISAANQ